MFGSFNPFSWFSKSTQKADPAAKVLQEKVDHVTHIIRDTGMQSRNVREAVEVLAEAAPTFPGLSLFMDQFGFRSLTQSIRDWNEPYRLSLLNRATTQSVVNPIGARGMTIRTDLIVSEGFKPVATSENPKYAESVQKILDDHWSYNEWDERLFERTFDWQVAGEMFRQLPPIRREYKNPSDEWTYLPGRFSCGAIIPQLVRGVTLVPWNYEQLDSVFLQEYGFGASVDVRELKLKIVRDDKIGPNRFGHIRGECFYLSCNRPPGASRGISDMAAALDWMDLHSQVLMNDNERAQLMMRFIWDVTINGATPGQLKEYARDLKIASLKAGTVRIHNEREIWDAISPDLRLSDTKTLRDDIFRLAWGCLGLPLHWYTDAENINRASSDNMSDPAFAWARTRRRMLSEFLLLECRYAVQIAQEAGRLNDIPIDGDLADNLGVKIVSRDPDRKSYETVGAAWADIGNALNVFTQLGLIDPKSAAQIVAHVVSTYGFEIDENAVNKLMADKEAAAQNQMGMDAGEMQQAGAVGQQMGQNPNAPGQINMNGAMNSQDPLEAVMTEAMNALNKAKRENKDLYRLS